jgi:hypothetical protein
MSDDLDEDDYQNVSSRIRASYGQACLACVTSKTKCELTQNATKCKRYGIWQPKRCTYFKRCRVLSKECKPTPAKRRKGLASKRSKPSLASVASKTADLEQKLDGITQLLQATQADRDGSLREIDREREMDRGREIHREREMDRGREIDRDSESSSSRVQQSNASSAGRPSTPPQSSAAPMMGISVSSLWGRGKSPKLQLSYRFDRSFPTETEAELIAALDTYRSVMVPIFPIMPLGKEETVSSMSKERPFLWFVIRAACCKNVKRQIAMGKEIRVILAQEMIIEGTKSMDLLLGLLVFSGWCHHWVFRKPMISLALHLGMSLVADLAINKPVPAEQEDGILNISSSGCLKPPHLVNRGPRTLEERRALISMFLVGSM